MDIETSYRTRTSFEGTDIGVKVTVDGVEFYGEVTLIADRTGSLRPWGAPDNWASAEVLAAAEASGDYAATLSLVAAAAA